MYVRTSEMSDEELFKKAVDGDEASFQELYLRYRVPLYSFAFNLLGAAHVAEDVVHDCFVSLLNSGSRFNSEQGSLRAYLFGMVKHFAFRQVRKTYMEHSTRLKEASTGPFVNLQTDPLTLLLSSERQHQLHSAMLHLPAPQRQVLAMFELEDLSLSDIGNALGMKVGAVKARLHRARKTLKKWLK
jgi:RNA polymerase sigma-70 factor (ECF subfamily)